MAAFTLNEETAIDVLIFWVEGSDGSISYEENNSLKDVFTDLGYDLDTYYKTVNHINGLSTENVQALVNKAVAFFKNASIDKRRLIYLLCEVIAGIDGGLNSSEKKRLSELKSGLGL